MLGSLQCRGLPGGHEDRELEQLYTKPNLLVRQEECVERKFLTSCTANNKDFAKARSPWDQGGIKTCQAVNQEGIQAMAPLGPDESANGI